MDIQALTIFVDVVKLGSFAAAAQKHGKDPSNVSRTVARLEKSLDLTLLTRSTRKMALTEAGHEYLARIEPLLKGLESAADEVQNLHSKPTGKLSITASTAFGQLCLLPLLPKFYQQYPEIELELMFSEHKVDIISKNIDLALRLAPAFEQNLQSRKLFDTHYRVCASKEYIEQNPQLMQPEHLSQHACVTFSQPAYRKRWLFQNAQQQVQEVPVTPKLVTTSALALKQAVMQGLGVGLMAKWLIADDVKNGNLIDLFPSYQVTATEFTSSAWVVYPNRDFTPRKTKAMVEFLQANMLG